MSGVVLLNASNEMLSFVSWQRAVTLVVSGAADIVEAQAGRFIRSQHVSVPFPKIVRLVKYVYVRWFDSTTKMRPSKSNVLSRDLNTCIYCGGNADTVDHLLPRSRGGGNTWENLAACCFPCNNVKADRTPREAGLKPLWEPYEFNFAKARKRHAKAVGLAHTV